MPFINAVSRRRFVNLAAVAAGSAAAGVARGERYQLGCMTMVYRAHPLPRALEGIRKAGYRYVVPTRSHAGENVFLPSLPPAARAELKRQFNDRGLTPLMSLGGFSGDLARPEGLKTYLAELDLCADFNIPVMVGAGPWYFTKFPNVPKRHREWVKEVAEFYRGLEQAVRHAESVKVTIGLKPHTGITARAKDCLEVVERVRSGWLKIAWDAGNVSFYEGIYPDPDLPDLAPHVAAVCIKDHVGGRAEANFPVPGTGQIEHEPMFRTLFSAGFKGPIAIERVDGRDNVAKMPAEVVDERIAKAYTLMSAILDRTAPAS